MMNSLNTGYQNCTLCPRLCGADRQNSASGICRMGAEAVVASAVLHMGEEPPLIGSNGSGTVFFSGCGLGCPFCQNVQISLSSKSEVLGSIVSVDTLAEIFLELERRGAVNINLVTASQFIPAVSAAILNARSAGFEIPVLWNSSGYEEPEALELLRGLVDVWLPDLKTLDSELSKNLFKDSLYPEIASKAIAWMADEVRTGGGPLIKDNLMKRGLIMRHLVIPGHVDKSREVLKWYSQNIMDTSLLSLMVQYTPVPGNTIELADPGYCISDDDYELLTGWLEDFGIDEGFLQGPEAADSSWIPDFSRQNPFPAEYSRPVWHYSCGFIHS